MNAKLSFKWKDAGLSLLLLLMLLSSSYAQTKSISGKIVDKQTGEAIIGVTIRVRDTNLGTISGTNGEFSLSLPPGADRLQVSFIGYESQEVRIGNETTIRVSLQSLASELNEVVVVGYGTQKKSDLTGAVTSVKAKDLTGIRGGNAAEALQGKSGMYVVSPGAPGASPDVRIRGIGTNGDATPVYVVDGMMTNNISFLNSKDIESIDILKDASATAIYGSRGANGVVMITTKKGKSGKPTFFYSGSEGFQYAIDHYATADAAGYATIMNRVAVAAGQDKPYQNPAQLGSGTNWMNEITRKGWMRDHQIAVSGGSENINYNLSLGYFSQKGIWKDTGYERWSARLNNEYKLTGKISVGHNLAFSWSNNGQPLSYRTVRSVLSASPLITPKSDQGQWNPMQNGDLINPVAELALNNDFNTKTLRFVGNAWGTWQLAKGLTFRTSLGEDYSPTYTDQFKPAYNINPAYQSNPQNTYREYYGVANTWLWENTLTLDKAWGELHRLNVLAGYTMEKNTTRGLGANARSYIVDNLDYVSIASASVANRTVETELPTTFTRMSYLFRANYTLKDRYLFTATLRADGSSRFGTNNRWGYFPSAALGWRVKEEAFLRNVDWLSNLKLRGSWGVTGNDKIVNNVSYALVSQIDEFHAVFNGKVYTAAGIVNANNPDVKWERNQQVDVGMDVGLAANRLSLELDYFNRKTKDLLMILPIKGGSAGISPTYSNAGSVQNSGFEFTARWQDRKRAFEYGFALSGTGFRNKVLDWGGQITTNNVWSTNLFTRIQEGEPFNYFYGYKTQGIYRTQSDLEKWNQYAQSKGQAVYHSAAKLGDLIYVDVNGDGIINEKDQTNIGSPFPKFTGSLSANAAYKGFDIILDFAGSFGAKVMNSSYNDFSSTTNNMHSDWEDAWTPENTGAAMPRLAGGSINTSRTIDLMVFSGNYFKLRSAELGYTLPQTALRRMRVSKLRVYLSAANLLYFTRYKGFTPEILDGLDWNSYPLSGSAQVGLNITF